MGALFLMVLLPSAATLVWLGVQLLEQDRRLWADRDLERRESAADVIARALGQKVATAEADLTKTNLPEGGLFARISRTNATVYPPGRVLWLPTAPHLTEANRQAFAEAESAEFQQRGDRGRSTYTVLAGSANPAVQAGAWLRLARLQRSSGDLGAAIRSYRQLAHFTDVSFEGMPVDLLARRALCDLLEQTRDTASLTREADAIRVDFERGRWGLDRAGWALVADDIQRWTGRPVDVTPERQAFTAGVNWLWQQYTRGVEGGGAEIPPSGRHALQINAASFLLLWSVSGNELTAFILPPAVVERWAHAVMPPELAATDTLVLSDEAGTTVSGTKADAATRLVTRLATETGLPWNVTLKPVLAPRDLDALTSRRRLLGAGLGAIVLLISGGSYLLWRTVHHEIAVARMQTDFVAAVSHEFRTPLTSLQHVTELLVEDDELPRERRQSLYAAIGRSTGRLRGLVESLLDFARMEDGRKPYDLQPVDLSLLAHNVLSEFERHVSAAPATITAQVAPSGLACCRADAAALGHALWNLLDNAVKYSPEPHHVTVAVGRRGDDAWISVRDEGFGIPARERQTIFHKFVRGSDSVRRGITGTGLGLAMVSHIVAAHGGRIELESEEGRGSTFTIFIPAHVAAAS